MNELRNTKAREYRKINLLKVKEIEHNYRHSLRGNLTCTYKRMLDRVKGNMTQKRSIHHYKGLEILDRQEFLEWALKDKEYTLLHKLWVLSNYDIKYAPSINRIDSSKGYTIDNIEWLTHSENSRLGVLNRWYGGTIR